MIHLNEIWLLQNFILQFCVGVKWVIENYFRTCQIARKKLLELLLAQLSMFLPNSLKPIKIVIRENTPATNLIFGRSDASLIICFRDSHHLETQMTEQRLPKLPKYEFEKLNLKVKFLMKNLENYFDIKLGLSKSNLRSFERNFYLSKKL